MSLVISGSRSTSRTPITPHAISRCAAASSRATTDGGAQSIDEISGKYLGRLYPKFGGRPEARMILTIEADSVRGMCAQ
jgi:hypothetical protein